MELSDKNVNATIIKLLQEAITSSLETNEKVENLWKQTLLKESSENFKTQKCNNQNKSKRSLSLIIEWR